MLPTGKTSDLVQTLQKMAMKLSLIFYGSSYVGFDIMRDIDPLLGPPLMYIFVTLSSILLMGSLTGTSSSPLLNITPCSTLLIEPGMLSNSFSRVISHAREEYLYVYSVYVLEASTSNRLTHFYPPFNLLALCIFRPLRLFLPSDDRFRSARILLLKATHLPIVGAIMLYETIRGHVVEDEFAGFKGPANLPTAATASGETPRRKASRARVRPVSSSSQQQRPQSMSAFEPFPAPSRGRVLSGRQSRLSLPSAVEAVNVDDVEPPTEVEVRIAVLSAKIDKLMDFVLAIQKDRDQASGSSPDRNE